ncbi:hypothetical protein DBR17_17905 [Sphingomonas sp. HMWF008]|nr:hypothetical protein DBR17_17905 [Sphingomonas sp. HMWF008]
MSKRRSSLDTAQLGFTFDPPALAREDASLAGLDRVVAATVARALKEDTRSRPEIAGAMSALLSEEVSAGMLDAYASEARDNHNISAHRALALIAATKRFDLLDAVMRRIGAALFVGEEILAAQLGHLQARQDQISAEIKKLRATAQPITRNRDA